MPKFPIDAPKKRAIKALKALGFEIIRDAEHIAMARRNPDGTRSPDIVFVKETTPRGGGIGLTPGRG